MTRGNGQAGVTVFEILVVVAIIGITVGVTALNLEPLETPLASSVTLTEGFMRQARLNAIASTSAVRVSPATSSRLTAETASSCAASTWTSEGSNQDLAQGVTVTATDWTVCFSSRGISDGNVTIGLHHATYGDVSVEVLLGGTTRVLE